MITEIKLHRLICALSTLAQASDLLVRLNLRAERKVQ